MQTVLEIVFWSSVMLVVFAYLGYPLVIYVCSRLFGVRQEPADWCEEELPRVSLLIAAYNECSVIGERIENALALDYPSDKLQIVIASDGSDDGTNEIVATYADHGVVLLPFFPRAAAVVLNDAAPQVQGEIVMFSDANTMMEPQAVRRVVRWLADDRVGSAVCGWFVRYHHRSECGWDLLAL